jgi:two-component system cell cycle response regulator
MGRPHAGNIKPYRSPYGTLRAFAPRPLFTGMTHQAKRIVLIDPSPGCEALARRLRAQDYVVDIAPNGAAGAELALASPPAAIIADLWMPGVSGIQLCRLIRSEPATCDVPFILRGETDDRRERFWAERAGAVAYVARGRLSELVRALDKAIAARKTDDEFFMQLAEGDLDIRDRIAKHLDKALFESVIASEIRALATSDSVERLLDRFSQFFSQVCTYRWLALATSMPGVGRARLTHVGLHHAPAAREMAEKEACAALGISSDVPIVHFEDEDAIAAAPDHSPVIRPIFFGGNLVGRIAIAPGVEPVDEALVSLVARELSGPLRLAALVEESKRLADTDGLTGLMNRRAFLGAMQGEIPRCDRHGYGLVVLLLDVDHFKAINDKRGHGIGDRVLAALGAMLKHEMRASDFVARWGGEEFVVALTSTDAEGGHLAGERVRSFVEGLDVRTDSGEKVPVTASVGVASRAAGESLDLVVDRADKAMYRAKGTGRNRVVGPLTDLEPAPPKILSALAS